MTNRITTLSCKYADIATVINYLIRNQIYPSTTAHAARLAIQMLVESIKDLDPEAVITDEQEATSFLTNKMRFKLPKLKKIAKVETQTALQEDLAELNIGSLVLKNKPPLAGE